MEVKNYLGIDWGEKRIGLASADSETRLALPFKTVGTLKELLLLIKEEEVDIIVIGSPKKINGLDANNPLLLEFVKQLKKGSAKPLYFLDERLSSLAADALSGRKRDKAERDEIAAAIILQDYLDSHGAEKESDK
jgi:putative Holliday junction resolvase